MSQGIKPVSQARSAQTRDKIITALMALLETRDFDQISMADIAERAGVAVGTLYRRFENKDAFIPVMLEQYRRGAAEMVEREDPELELELGPGLHATLRNYARQTNAHLKAHAPLLRTLYLYSRFKTDLVWDDWRALEDRALADVERLLDHFAEEIRHPDRHRAAIMIGSFFATAFTDRALFPDVVAHWIASTDDETFVTEMADLAYSYLTRDQA